MRRGNCHFEEKKIMVEYWSGEILKRDEMQNQGHESN